MLRSTIAVAALLLASMPPLAAQAGPPGEARVLLVPQFGVPVSETRGSSFLPTAAIVAEVPVARGWSLFGEGMATLGEEQWACPDITGTSCHGPTTLRLGLSAGVMAQPGRIGRIAPFAGVAAGGARWTEEQESGIAPMASLRGGVDVQIAGPVGARVELIRRIAWTGSEHGSPVHTDAVSVGARLALRR